jgi:hypothetical protein
MMETVTRIRRSYLEEAFIVQRMLLATVLFPFSNERLCYIYRFSTFGTPRLLLHQRNAGADIDTLLSVRCLSSFLCFYSNIRDLHLIHGTSSFPSH